MIRAVDGVRNWMEDIKFERGDVQRRLKRIHCGKQPGPDCIKGEIYRCLGRSEICVDKLVEVYNRLLEEEGEVLGWKFSKTIMLPKVKKPQSSQHRPIALTNIGYKTFMGLLKEKVSEQSRGCMMREFGVCRPGLLRGEDWRRICFCWERVWRKVIGGRRH